MGYKRKLSVLDQGRSVLLGYFAAGRGTSKYHDKVAEGKSAKEEKRRYNLGKALQGKIYSDETFADYNRKWKYYCDSMAEDGFKVNGHKPQTLQEAALYMPLYIEKLKAKPGNHEGYSISAWTVRSYFAGPAKILGLSAKDFDLPQRKTSEIRRSRLDCVRDAHFSEAKNAELVTFGQCVGLRNKKELQAIRGTDLVDLGNGRYGVNVSQGKGGKARVAEIHGSPAEVSIIIEKMKAAGTERVWPKVSSAADMHGYRADYVCRWYRDIARPADQLPRSERYDCRIDGNKYDKAALRLISNWLGHSRLDVVVQNYLYKL